MRSSMMFLTFIWIYKNYLNGVESPLTVKRQIIMNVQKGSTSPTSSAWSVPLVICKLATISEFAFII